MPTTPSESVMREAPLPKSPTEEREDSPPAPPPHSSARSTVILSPDRTRKRITIAKEEVSATRTVVAAVVTPVEMPSSTPLKENTTTGTPPTARISRSRPSMSSSSPRVAAVPAVPSILTSQNRVSPTRSRYEATSVHLPSPPQRPSSMAATQRWTPRGTPRMRPTGEAAGPSTEEAETARRSPSFLDWSFFRQGRAAAEDEDGDTRGEGVADEVQSDGSSSCTSSDNSARTYGQRREEARLNRTARGRARRDTIGLHCDSRDGTDDDVSTRASHRIDSDAPWSLHPVPGAKLSASAHHSIHRTATRSPYDQTVLIPSSGVRRSDGGHRLGSEISGEEARGRDNDYTWPSAHNAPLDSSQLSGSRSSGHRHLKRQRQRRQYVDHWTQVVLTVTSAILFVVVIAMSYALYRMTLPYWRSIWSSVLLSIVLHPRSRLRYSLYKGTCIHRMERCRRRWARRGPLFGVVGSWCSLVPFASFVIMQGVFFFGLNKVERRVLVEVTTTAPEREGGKDAPHPRTVADLSPPSPPLPVSRKNTATTPVSTTTETNATLENGEANTSAGHASLLGDTLRLPENAVEDLARVSTRVEASDAAPMPRTTKMVLQRQRIVATVSGRRVLRLGMVTTLAVLSHLLLGIQYLLLMHLLLLVVFALTVPFLPPRGFLIVMGRVWRFAIALFLLVGLAFNLAEDVLSVSGAVRRTTSELVATRAASSMISGSGVGLAAAAERHTTAAHANDGVDPSDPAWTSLRADGEPHASQTGLVTSLWDTYKDDITDLVTSYVKENLLSELSDMFNQTNMTEAASGLLGILHLGNRGSGSEKEKNREKKSPGSTTNAAFSHSLDSSVTAAAAQGGALPSIASSADGDASHEERGRSRWSVRRMWSAWFSRNLTRTIVYSSIGAPSESPALATPPSSSASATHDGSAGEVDWLGISQLLAKKLLPYVQYARRVFVYLCGNLLNFFDSLYALMLFVFFFRFLTTLEHTVLYYAIAKVLKVLQPEYGEVQARHIEKDITVSFITLLQSFWHLTWFHFSLTFCVFKMVQLPTSFFCGAVSVILAIFPLVPKWMSPCAVAMVMCAAGRFSKDGFLGVVQDLRVIGLFVSTVVDMSDEWLLCVSRSIRGNFITDAAGFEREQLHPFVVGTALVLGFVTWGAGGIVLGPLTVIVAKVIYDNWDKLLAPADPSEYDDD